MKITYKIDLEDLFVFSAHLIQTSSLIRRAIRKGQLWWASGPLVGGLILLIVKGTSPEKALMTLFILSVAISTPMFFMYPNYFTYSNKKRIKKLFENNSYKNILGVHEMTISDEYLTDKSEHSDIKIPWNSITKIESTSDQTYIFTTDITAYIIPHKRISVGNPFQFTNKLNAVFKEATDDLNT